MTCTFLSVADVVDAHAGAADDLEVGRARQDVRGHLGGRAHREAVVRADDLGQLRRRQAHLHVDGEAGLAHQLDSGLGQIISDKNLDVGHASPSSLFRPAGRAGSST
jgi:hypothetical protein